MTPRFHSVDARVVVDPGELIEFFSNDRAAHVYSLIDLEEPYWSSSTWFRRGDAVVGVIANPTDGIITATAVSTKDPSGSSALLTEIVGDLPSGLMLTGPTGVTRAVAAIRPAVSEGEHVKHELRDRSIALDPDALAPVDAVGRLIDLRPSDADRLAALYATRPGEAFFLPTMLEDRSFVGVEAADGRLVAAAGTHLLSERQRLAAVGSVFVEPRARGAGLGRAVTAGVIRRVHERCDVIGLNVAVANEAARGIYERLGFVSVLTYEETSI